MYHTRDPGLILRLYGETVAAVPLGDHRIRQVIPVAVQKPRHAAVDLVRRLLHAPSHPGKSRRGIVRHLLFGNNAAPDLVVHRSQGLQKGKILRQTVPALLFLLASLAAVVGLRPGGHRQNGADCQKLRNGEGGSDLQTLQGVPDLLNAPEGQGGSLQADPVLCIRGVLLPGADPFRVRIRLYLPAQPPSCLRGGEGGKLFDHFIKFQYF